MQTEHALEPSDRADPARAWSDRADPARAWMDDHAMPGPELLTVARGACDGRPTVLERGTGGRLDGVVRKYIERLRQLARRLTGDHARADDLVQQVLVRAVEHEKEIVAHPNPGAWLVRVLRNLFIDQCRQDRRSPAVPLDEGQVSLEPEPESPWAKVTPEQLAEAIEELSPELRDVLEAWRRGCPYEVIARDLGIPKNTVGTRLRRARLALRKRLFGRSEDE